MAGGSSPLLAKSRPITVSTISGDDCVHAGGKQVGQGKLAIGGGRDREADILPTELEREASRLEPLLSDHGAIDAKHAAAEVRFDKKVNHLAGCDALCSGDADLLADRFHD